MVINTESPQGYMPDADADIVARCPQSAVGELPGPRNSVDVGQRRIRRLPEGRIWRGPPSASHRRKNPRLVSGAESRDVDWGEL
jgi:hypothetical protein